MFWASRQVRGATGGVPVTPLPKGSPQVRDWPLEVLRGAFEASTLPITTVEAMGELLGEITRSWASAPSEPYSRARTLRPPSRHLRRCISRPGWGGGGRPMGEQIAPKGSENWEP